MLHKPTIIIQRLIVTGQGRRVYDQCFRKGVNVIYGENASGKSTILDFIFYVLGGENVDWSPAALRCNRVYAEVELNGTGITLARDISEARNQPLSISWHSMENALQSSPEVWELYPYRSSTKESFSQVLFKAMDMPEVPAGDEATNITMHQILRLVYQDQMSSPEDIFRPDDFDRELTKETVGELMCGVYDPQLYSDQLRLREVDREFSDIQAEMRSLFQYLGVAGESLNAAVVERELEEAIAERERVYTEIENVSAEEKPSGAAEKTTQDRLRTEANQLGAKIVEQEETLASLRFQILEATRFISSLEQNLEALGNSELTYDTLGAIPYEFCPACFTPVTGVADAEICPLCKSKLDLSTKRPHQLRVRRELEMQLRESKTIQAERTEEIKRIEANLASSRARRAAVMQEYRLKAQSVLSPAQTRMRQLSERAGWLQRQIEVLGERIKVARRVEELSARKAALAAERTKLSDRIEAIKRAMEQRRSVAYTLLADITRELLRDDLDREDGFRSARHVNFSFGKERITVDGQTRFAASSSVYLKNSFSLALLLASTRDYKFRYPRLLMLDAIEDKGMEAERIHHFQDIVLARSKGAAVDHQIILTAQTLSGALLADGAVIGDRYTHDRKTLDVVIDDSPAPNLTR